MLDFWNNYPIIQKRLQAVCSLIEQRVTIDNREIQEALLDFTRSGGKMLRPAFFLLFAELAEEKRVSETGLLELAASLELLHMATLVHDDIIDDSPLRRGEVTIQARYGKDVAVYTGDLLFTIYFEILIEHINGSPFMAENAQAMKRLLLGELDQMQTRFLPTKTLDQYLNSITGKTAELFRLACVEGAYFGGADENTQQLAATIGQNIGIVFQIYDDILDYVSSTATLKKPALEDLAQGIYTLPLLLARQADPAAFEPYLNDQITKQEAKKVARLVKHYQGVKKAKAFAQTYIDEALVAIQQLPAGPAQQMITQLADQLLKRTY